MPDVIVNCPNCNQDYTIDPSTLGRQFKCVQCGQTFTASAPAVDTPAPVSYQPVATMPPSYLGEAPPGLSPRSRAAFASLICGFLCWIWPVSIAGLVLGIVGIGKTRNNKMRGGGMAVTGVVLGAIGLIIDLPLMFCIFVGFLGARGDRQAAYGVQSQHNLEQIGVAIAAYQARNNQAYPPDLETLITTQRLSPALFVYPGGSDTPASSASTLESGGHLSYVYLGDATGTLPVATTMPYEDRVVLYEKGRGHMGDDPTAMVGGVMLGLNILYADGHVAFEEKANAQAIIAKTRAALKLPAAGN